MIRNVLRTLCVFLLAFAGIPLVVGLIIKATGSDHLWGVAKISQFFVIFYYYGLANAEQEISKGLSALQLPLFIKRLLFLDAPNRFTKCTFIYQAVILILTLISLFLVFFMKMESFWVADRYLICGLFVIIIATVFWKRSFRKR